MCPDIFAQDEAVDEGFDVQLETTRFLPKSVDRIVALPDGKLFVIGNFNRFNGQKVGGFIRLNADATLDPTFNNQLYHEKTPNVGVPLPLSDGRFILPGRPMFADGTQHPSRFARMNSDGTIDPTYSVALGGAVFRWQLDSEGRLVVTGYLEVERNGQTVSENIVRFNTDGSLDATFDAGNYSIQGPLTCWNDKILFVDLVGKDIRFHRLNTDGTPDLTFTPRLLPGHWPVDLAAQADGKIIARTLSSVLRLNADASIDTGFQLPSGVTGSFLPIEIMPDGRITLAYHRADPYGMRVVRVLPSGEYDPSFTPYDYLGAQIESFAVQSDGGVLIGDSASNSASNRFMRLAPDGAVDTSFNQGGTGFLSVVEGKVRGIRVLTDQRIMVGGDFQRVNGVDRNRIARLTADGSLDPTFQITVGTTGSVFTAINDVYGIVEQPDGKLLVNGDFSYLINGLSGPTQSSLVRLNADGSIDATFRLDYIVPNQFVGNGIFWGKNKTVLDSANRILVGTSRVASYEPWNVPRRYSPNGTWEASFAPTLFTGLAQWASVFDIAIQPDGKILISGQMRVSEVTVGFIARLNTDGSRDMDFTGYETPGRIVFAFKLMDDGRIVIVSRGVTEPHSMLLRLNANGTVDGTFNAGTGANGTVEAIESLEDGRLLIGGTFTTYDDEPRKNFAVLGPNGDLLPFAVDINNGVLAIAKDGEDRILLGGTFTAIRLADQQYNRSYLARMKVGSGGTARRTLFDYDGDGTADLSVSRPSDNFWYLKRSYLGFTGRQWGVEGDRSAPADYDGDGKTDLAVFRPSDGTWYVVMSGTGAFQSYSWGEEGDLPVPADHDGDGRADLVVYRPADNVFYKASVTGGPFEGVQFGVAGDKPVVGDFDADGKADVAVFRPSDNNWYVFRSTGGFTALRFGETGDIPVPADYDGDGATDPAVYRPSTGFWYMVRSGSTGYDAVSWGVKGDVPAPADYDGDGKADPAVFRPSDGMWYLYGSTAGMTGIPFGQSGDIPTPSAFIY